MDELAEIRQTFFEECDEQLSALEAGLLAATAGSLESSDVNAMFRAVHSMKGGAGAFNLTELVRFAHVFESTLDEMRSERLHATPEVVEVLLRAADLLSDLVHAARDEGVVASERIDEIGLELRRLCDPAATGLDSGEEEIDLDALFADVALPVAEVQPERPTWLISFRPHGGLYAHAGEPLLILRELRRMGSAQVELDCSALPALGDLRAEESYLRWTVRLETTEPEDEIRRVFEFFEDECDLDIRPEARPQASNVVDFAAPAPAPALEPVRAVDDGEARLVEEEDDVCLTAEIPAAIRPAAKAAPREGAAPSAPGAPVTVRVELDRVDRLINLLGELVINQAMLAQRVSEAGLGQAKGVEMCMTELEQLTREIQDSVMSVRAQPVKPVFQRMTRVAREAAAISGKKAQLVFDGEMTEVDKTIIERLADPLTHMIRNAIDHGLEKPELRIANGKPETGVIRLKASHRSGRIVIEVGDDGAGINRQRVRAIAVERGLIAEDAQLSEEETDGLIFLPGFSTASTISDISGRGVGMDVVKQAISDMGGRISITSRQGEGSTFSMSLPLTLAVLDGIVLSVYGQTLVIPITAVVETLQLRPELISAIDAHHQVIRIRQTYLPMIEIGSALGFDPAHQVGAGVALLVEGESGRRAVFVADAIQGQRQVVIKSLEANYQQVDGVAAATILGDGRVALIVDVEKLLSVNDASGDTTRRLSMVA